MTENGMNQATQYPERTSWIKH